MVRTGRVGRRGRASVGRLVILALVGLCVVFALLAAAGWAYTGRADGSIVSGGEKRSYLLHVPASYDPARPAPLVISMHGFASWPEHQMMMTRWNDLADRYGFIVVYPSGTGIPRRWHAFDLDLSGEGINDVTFISDLIDDLARRYSIDATRVYANGMSNGGGMSYLLACRLADRIAAVGGVAGAYVLSPDGCQPARPVPFIAFHGTADPIVPYHGTGSTVLARSFPDLPGFVAAWARRNGCSAPAALPQRGEVTGVHYTGCREGADVVFYTIEGGGHTWPGGEPLPFRIAGRTTQDIDATAVMWEFFSRHALGAAQR